MYAAITGWGKCLPPAILSNDDLATFLDTSDEWITSRTGMKERRISHVDVSELGYVAAARALAAAGKQPEDVELIVFGSTTFDELCPNGASNIQRLLGAENAACMDLNTACTSGMYSLTVATSMIKSGVVKSAIIIGAEVISKVMDWSNRDVAVLFGDGAAALYLEASTTAEGVLAESLGCFGEARDILSLQGWGMKYADKKRILGDVQWAFVGQEIFKKAVNGMTKASQQTLEKSDLQPEDIDLVVPHQANLRIIDTLTKKLKMPNDKVFINIERYGNMSAATALVALVEAVEEGYVKPGNLLLMPAFGGGLTLSAHLVKWGERTQPVAQSAVELPENTKTGLEMVNALR
ncbi:ketoacyl-ACP synthase III [Desulfosediminicola flagellatus]|uniref:ketoacyl-ACP synthase III n=1 Tax=Desulfosediminicola flagellatus TaxID=2569541 RepID=UPI0010AB6FD9|nr:ketoacyl-ACP synthase III [Desulfosediminicola flagellatus]